MDEVLLAQFCSFVWNWKKKKQDNYIAALHWFQQTKLDLLVLCHYKCVHQMVPLARHLHVTITYTKKVEFSLRFGRNDELLFLLPFSSLLLFLLFVWMWPPKASELQTVHCIVGNVVDIFHGCRAEDVHLCLGGFGTRGPLFGCFRTPSLLGRPWTVGPWFPRFGGLWRKIHHLYFYFDKTE